MCAGKMRFSEDDVCWENAVFTELDPILDDYLSGKEDFKESDLEEGGDQILTTYEIDGTRLKAPADVADPNSLDETLANLQADHAYHREVWAYFAKLIPAEQRRDLIRFQAVSDGEGEVLASVEPDTDDPKKWIINVDILDAQADMKELTYTLVHEFAHVLTLNNRQVPMDTETIGKCQWIPTFFSIRPMKTYTISAYLPAHVTLPVKGVPKRTVTSTCFSLLFGAISMTSG